jgi:hypothetical protein
MELMKIDKKIKRISTLYESFREEGKISQLEKDLLLGYIRELYELVMEIETANIPNQITSRIDSVKQTQEINNDSTVEKMVVIEKPMENTVQAVSTKIIQIIEPIPEIVQNPSVITESEQTDDKVVIQTNNLQEIPKPFVNISTELRQLFTITKARDISERLAMSPISDIAKAMSINDKMLILKELFGNDTGIFNDSIAKLNGFNSFDEAKDHLLEAVAVKYHWDHPEKLEKAEAFVKLVSRRYTSSK